MLSGLSELGQAYLSIFNLYSLAYGLSGDDKKAAEIAKLDLDAAGVQENLGYYEFLRLLQDRNAIASTLGAHQTDELK